MTKRTALFVVGLGVVIPSHISIQATRAMSECSELFSIVQEPEELWVPAVRDRQIKVTNLLESYLEGRLRIENYDGASQKVIGAIGPDRTVGYVTYGNPMSYDRVASTLVRYGKDHDLRVEIVPGISSIDTLLCDIGVDMAPAIQIFDASWLVACKVEPINEAPLVLVQVGTFGSLRTHYTKRLDGSSLRELVEYLCKFYPKAQRVILVRSTGSEDHPVRTRAMDLGRLCEVSAEDLSGASLYIPMSNEPRFDKSFLARMERD